MTTPIAPDTATSLRQFVATPAYGATGLHILNREWKASLGQRVASEVVDEVLSIALDADGDSGSAGPRQLVISWVAHHGELARFETQPREAGPDLMRVALEEARSRRIPVSLTYSQDNGFSTSNRQTGGLYYPRPLPNIGKLGAEVRVLDTADRFDASITRIKRPGLVGRKVLRREAVPVTFNVTMDRERTHISYDPPKSPTNIGFVNADLLGVVHANFKPLAITSTEAHRLPDLADWSPVDFRGQELSTWIYERMMQRLGI